MSQLVPWLSWELVAMKSPNQVIDVAVLMWQGVSQEERDKKRAIWILKRSRLPTEAMSSVEFFDVNAAIIPDGGMQSCQTGKWKWSLAMRSSRM